MSDSLKRKYKYNGSAISANDEYLGEFHLTTQAVSIEKAMQNFKYQVRQKLGWARNSFVSLSYADITEVKERPSKEWWTGDDWIERMFPSRECPFCGKIVPYGQPCPECREDLDHEDDVEAAEDLEEKEYQETGISQNKQNIISKIRANIDDIASEVECNGDPFPFKVTKAILLSVLQRCTIDELKNIENWTLDVCVEIADDEKVQEKMTQYIVYEADLNTGTHIYPVQHSFQDYSY